MEGPEAPEEAFLNATAEEEEEEEEGEEEEEEEEEAEEEAVEEDTTSRKTESRKRCGTLRWRRWRFDDQLILL